ncbi:transporter substrate-binding domain-containing protein [Jeongeupia wiesaeckerbachi]|uniref:transporter substrate-binding domain-containing protein n=1 Tax=Jeongeupia wiesaeckerbachi TaxID=3051218 RepID=UPI003D8012A3
MKRILSGVTAIALSAGMLLAASPALAGKLEDIKSRGVVRIGVSLGGEPVGFRDARNNPIGYDVDVATRLAAKLGVKPEFTDVSGDARVSMLMSGQLDLVVANVSITPERQKAIDFSKPYNRAGLRVIVQKKAGIKDLKGLTGKQIVVGRGSTGEAFIRREVPGAKLVYTDNFAPDGVLLLQQGRVEAGIEDSSLLDYLATKNDKLVTLPGLYSNDPIGIGIAKGDPAFLKTINDFVADYVKSGAYESNYKKWWGKSANPPKLD